MAIVHQNHQKRVAGIPEIDPQTGGAGVIAGTVDPNPNRLTGDAEIPGKERTAGTEAQEDDPSRESLTLMLLVVESVNVRWRSVHLRHPDQHRIPRMR